MNENKASSGGDSVLKAGSILELQTETSLPTL